MHPALVEVASDLVRSQEADAWHAALLLALSIPEICAAAEGRQPGPQAYCEWYDAWVLPRWPPARLTGREPLAGVDAYALRAAFLHPVRRADAVAGERAFLDTVQLVASRATEPGSSGKFERPNFGGRDRPTVSCGYLCGLLAAGMTDWWQQRGTTDAVASRLDRLLRIPRPSAP